MLYAINLNQDIWSGVHASSAHVQTCGVSPVMVPSNVSNVLSRQHCLHVLVHAIFAGCLRVCLELLTHLRKEELILWWPV